MEEKQIMTQEQLLLEIYKNTNQTKNYIKWQLIITIALVVIPFIAMLVIIPMIFKTLGANSSGIIDPSLIEQLK